MGEERRRAVRIPLEMVLSIDIITDFQSHEKTEISVITRDISKGGISFAAEKILEKGSFYKAKIIMPNHEVLDVVIEIVRITEEDGGSKLYGSRFVGMGPEDEFRIEAFRLVCENMSSADNRG